MPVIPSAGALLLTIPEAAARLRLSPRGLYGLIRRGIIPAVRRGIKQWGVFEADLTAWLEGRRNTTPPVPPDDDQPAATTSTTGEEGQP